MIKRSITASVFLILLVMISCVRSTPSDSRGAIQMVQTEEGYRAVAQVSMELVEVRIDLALEDQHLHFAPGVLGILRASDEESLVALAKTEGKFSPGDLLFQVDSAGRKIRILEEKVIADWGKLAGERADQTPCSFPVLLGDLTGDGKVGLEDFGLFRRAFGSRLGMDDYLPQADIYPASNAFGGVWAEIWDCALPDGVINIFDFGVFRHNFGTTMPDDPANPTIALIQPEDQAQDLSESILFTWAATPGAHLPVASTRQGAFEIVSFEFYLAGVREIYGPAIELTTDRIRVGDLGFGQEYRWKVVAVQNDGRRAVSEERRFTTKSEPDVGKARWRVELGDESRSSPAIAPDGTIYVGTEGGKLFAVRPDGLVKWQVQPAGSLGAPITNSVALGRDGTVYVASDRLYAYSPSGEKLWDFPTDSFLYASPAIARDGTIFIATLEGVIYAISPEGERIWRYATESQIAFSGPVIGSDGTLYVGAGFHLFALDRKGNPIGVYSDDIQVTTIPAIGGNDTIYAGFSDAIYALADGELQKLLELDDWERIYASPAVGFDGIVYFGTDMGTFHAFQPQSRGLLWSYDADAPIESSPALGADGSIYFGQDDGILIALDASGGELWTFETEEPEPIRSSPSLASDGTLYFTSLDGYLYAIRTESKGLANSPWPKLGQNKANTASVEDKWVQFRITAESQPADGGKVTIDQETPSTFVERWLWEEDQATLLALPEEGWKLEGWYRGGLKESEQNEYTVFVNSNVSYSAHFVRDTEAYLVTVSASPTDGGMVQIDEGPWDTHTEKTVESGTKATIAARASDNWKWVGWKVDGQMVKENPYTFVVRHPTTIEAIFERILPFHAITVESAPTEAGEVKILASPWGPSHRVLVEEGRSVGVEARPQLGWIFEGWYEQDQRISEERLYEFDATSERLLQARFLADEQLLISGTVFWANGEPLHAGRVVTPVRVELYGVSEHHAFETHTFADDQGAYVFRGLSPGAYTVLARAENNLDYAYDMVSLHLDESKEDVDLMLRRKPNEVWILREAPAWGQPNAVTDVLEAHGFEQGEGPGTYRILDTLDIRNLQQPPGTDTLVIVEGDQDDWFYDMYEHKKDIFDAFVEIGGTLFWIASDWGWNSGAYEGDLPQGVEWEADYRWDNLIVNRSNPLLAEFPDRPLQGCFASHGGFTNLEGLQQLTVLIEEYGVCEEEWWYEQERSPNISHRPTYIIYPYGYGRVIATTAPLEFYLGNLYEDYQFFALLLWRSVELGLGLPFTTLEELLEHNPFTQDPYDPWYGDPRESLRPSAGRESTMER